MEKKRPTVKFHDFMIMEMQLRFAKYMFWPNYAV